MFSVILMVTKLLFLRKWTILNLFTDIEHYKFRNRVVSLHLRIFTRLRFRHNNLSEVTVQRLFLLCLRFLPDDGDVGGAGYVWTVLLRILVNIESVPNDISGIFGILRDFVCPWILIPFLGFGVSLFALNRNIFPHIRNRETPNATHTHAQTHPGEAMNP